MQAAGAGARAEQGLEQEPLRTIEDALPGRGSVTRHGSLVSDQWSGANQTYLVWFSGCGRLATATARQDSTMARYRGALPQAKGELMITDGGIETDLIFHRGFDLPLFAAFPLVADDSGREALRRYYEEYAGIARANRVGLVLESPTWRANPDWAPQLGYTLEELDSMNRAAIALMEDIRQRHDSAISPIVVSGCVGPRGDGYVDGATMSADEAEEYHARQIGVFAESDADITTAITMAYAQEAVGVARAAVAARIPSAISFTVETDGRLPSGQPLGEAIAQVDDATGGAPAYFMINCAHPTHFAGALEPDAAWAKRIHGLRLNASTRSHAELDEAEELDEGNPEELGAQYRALRDALPAVSVLGGCCGTDQRHVATICSAWLAPAAG